MNLHRILRVSLLRFGVTLKIVAIFHESARNFLSVGGNSVGFLALALFINKTFGWLVRVKRNFSNNRQNGPLICFNDRRN